MRMQMQSIYHGQIEPDPFGIRSRLIFNGFGFQVWARPTEP